MYGMEKKTLTREEKFKQKINTMDINTLKEKFENLYFKYQDLVSESKESEIKTTEQIIEKEEPKPIIDIKPLPENVLNFSDNKVKRRQQYLHKTYTSNDRVLNGILKLAIENQDENLLIYLTNLNKELEAKEAEEKRD